MENKILQFINEIRAAKNLAQITNLNPEEKLRDDLEFTSFDLAELTVKIEDEFDIDIFEDGLVETVGEVIDKLTFTPSTEEKLTYLNEKLGEEAATFYYQLHNATNESFQEYIKTRFKGPNAAYDKAATYQKIDYTRAYNLIEKYQESKKKK